MELISVSNIVLVFVYAEKIVVLAQRKVPKRNSETFADNVDAFFQLVCQNIFYEDSHTIVLQVKM